MSKYKIKKVIIILLTITSITTIIGSLVYPEASRLLADGNTDVHRFYQLRNIGGYGFNYALCLSVPFLVHMYKETHKIRYTLLIVLFFVCIVLCSYVFAIVLFLAILFTSVVFVHRKKRYMKILFSVFALMLLLVYIVILKNDFFWDILLNKVKENAVLYQRIGDMANYFLDKNMTGDMKYRSYLYSLSVDAFKNSPLVGNLFGKVSNLSYHSEILDFLGGTGLFGMTFMFVLLLVIFSNYKVVLKDKLFSASIIILTFVLLILSYLNTVVGSVEITGIFAFLYIPINKYNSQKSCNMEATVCLKENCLTYYLK
ncbi:MAG: hypothetical protein K5765_02340 [Clostridia bacterium]|nr:hypothetical protein [Clostridia bacterium]